MKKALLLCLVASLLGCTSNVTKKGLTAEEYKELVSQTIFVIPDSLKTKEQLQLTLKVYDLLHRHVYVEDNCFILPVAKDSFEKEGIPTFYYDVLQYQFNDQNECIKRWLKEGDISAEDLDQERGFKEFSVRYKEVDRPKLIEMIESAQSISKLEERMMDFFCQTLKQNYGKADGEAVATLVEGLQKYKLHYIIDVDKKKCKKINDELFASALTGYFFNRDNSTVQTIILDKDRYDPYQPLICERYLVKPDGETYYQKELQASAHPFLKKVCREYEFSGNEGIPVYLGYMATNHLDCMADFEKDKDIRMFTTLLFWRYLCYCANIDFQTGEDKTAAVLRGMEKDFR